MNFKELGIDPRLVKALNNIDITRPTPIQKEAIPPALDRQDVLGIAPTGSGKTFAYALPILDWVLNAKVKHKDPTVLILVPTRELVKQVDKFIQELTRFTEVFTARVYAGQREGKQIRVIEEDVIDIIVATPGRLINFLEDNVISLANLSIFVIDEVDTLLDMGFLPNINEILSQLPHKNARQTLIFGSALPPEVEGLAKALQKRTKMIDIGKSKVPTQIEHAVFEAYEDEKFDVLMEILHDPDLEKVLIFAQSKHEVRITARNLRREGLELEELHGGLTQRQRNHAISNFKSSIVNAMVASDVAAMGLDIPDISHVISYDVPSDFNDYVHRAGRTGRAFREGVSWLIAAPKEFANLANIENKLGKIIPRIREIRSSQKESKSGKTTRIDRVVWKKEYSEN